MNTLRKVQTERHLTPVDQSGKAGAVLRLPTYNNLADTDLIMLCKRQDQRALAEMIRRHQKTVYGVLYRLAPDWNNIADLSQEVFVRMWQSITQLQHPSAFRSWLHRIIMNIFYDELRRRTRDLPTTSIDEPEIINGGADQLTREIPDESMAPDEYYQNRELRCAIEKAVAKLPEQFKTAMVLRDLSGLSYEEIANATGASIGTVKSRIARARAHVREQLVPFLQS